MLKVFYFNKASYLSWVIWNDTLTSEVTVLNITSGGLIENTYSDSELTIPECKYSISSVFLSAFAVLSMLTNLVL